MADPRTFTLIGNFTDNITPALEKINKSLDKVKTNLSSLQSVTKPLKKDFQELADVSNRFSSSLKSQSTDLRQMTAALKAYRSEMGRVNRAYRAGGSRLMRQAVPKTTPPPIPATQRELPQARNRREVSFAAGAGGAVAGYQLGEMITGSIVRGFQLGVSIMQKPFQYAATAFGERIRDEMTDIQSAGGLFATDLRKNLGLFRDFQEARVAQEAINYRLAKSAAALPGSTAEYVQEAKKITDTMINAMAKQPQQFVKLGEDFGAKTGDKMDALGAIIQRFTEKAVLLGKGSGGASRMYGMPQLLEMMVNMPRVNVQGMQKYSVLRGNPMLQAALLDAENQINATAAGTADRLRILMKVLDEALPNEVVQGMRNSMEGIVEVIRSSFLDPEVGLFGLGRKMKGIGPAVNQYGQLVDQQGRVVNEISQAARADLSLFALLRDAIGGFALPLSELAQILPELFDPLRKVGESLVRVRNVAQRFYANFNQYTAEFEALAKEIGGARGLEIKRTAGARGALLSVANLLRGIGAIDMAKYGDVAKQLQQTKPNLGAITGDLFKTLMSSDMMRSVGEAIGGLFGSVIKMVGDLMKGATDFTTAGPFAEGLKRGWDSAQGSLGVTDIFSNLFKLIFRIIGDLFKAAPFEMSIITALTVGMPLLSGAITALVTSMFERAAGSVRAAGRGGRGGFGGGGGFMQTRRMAARQRLLAYRARETARFGAEAMGLGYNVAGRPGSKALGAVGKRMGAIGKGIGRVGRVVPGGAVAAGAVDLATSMASGENFGKAAVGAFGTVLGGAAGSIFGPAGTVIGSIAGGMLADAASDLVIGATKQNNAAAMQESAAAKQLQAAQTKLGKVGVEDVSGLPGMADPMKLNATIQMLGYQGNQQVLAYQKASEQLRMLSDNTGYAKDKLFTLVESLKKQGYTSELIWKQTDVKALATDYKNLQEKTKGAAAQVDKTFKAMPQVMSRNIAIAMQKMDTKAIEYAIANKISMGTFNLNVNPRIMQGPGFPSPLFSLPAPTPASKDQLPDLFKLPAYPTALGTLGSAVMSELATMPSGSHLLVANSSETIMPKGYSMAMAQGGGDITINAPITIHQQPGQDSDELASIVAMKIGEAVAQARSSSVFV